jgi:8-oxo-dGTP diphosphatase
MVVTVNVLIFSIREGLLQVLLVKRAKEPFSNYWSLPGGVIGQKESLDGAAERLLLEKTGVKNIYLEQLYTFGDPKRDPRERRIAVTYYALIPSDNLKLQASGTAKDAAWFPVKKSPKLAFDHLKIVKYGFDRLKSKVGYSNVVFGLLRKEFRLSELQRAYEIILDKEFDKRNFRKKMQELNLLERTGRTEMEGAHRPAMLYKFRHKEIVFFD